MSLKDPIKRAAYLRDWKRRNPGRYAARQKATDAARHANHRASVYGAPGQITIDEAAEMLSVGRCAYCSTSAGLLTLDHVLPLHAGGLNRPANIVAACRACNISKFRQAAPGAWSRHHDFCVVCGTADRKHICHGMCERCYQRSRK